MAQRRQQPPVPQPFSYEEAVERPAQRRTEAAAEHAEIERKLRRVIGCLQTDDWREMRDLIERMTRSALAALMAEGSSDRVLFLQGRIDGLRSVLAIEHKAMADLAEINRRQKR